MDRQRGDGIVVDKFDMDTINQRMARAEYAAQHFNKTAYTWKFYYDDGPDSDTMINDFKRALWEINYLRNKVADLEYKIESMGGDQYPDE